MSWESPEHKNGGQLREPKTHLMRADLDALWECLSEHYSQGSLDLKESLCRLERHLLIRTLSSFEGNQKKTSEFLCMKPTTISAKCKKYNIKFETRVQ